MLRPLLDGVLVQGSVAAAAIVVVVVVPVVSTAVTAVVIVVVTPIAIPVSLVAISVLSTVQGACEWRAATDFGSIGEDSEANNGRKQRLDLHYGGVIVERNRRRRLHKCSRVAMYGSRPISIANESKEMSRRI